MITPSDNQSYKAPYDSFVPKILTFIPFLGVIPYWIAQKALDKEKKRLSQNHQDPQYKNLITVLNIKNIYKSASLVRGILEVAIIIATLTTCLTLGILNPIGVAALAGIGLLSAGLVIKKFIGITITGDAVRYIQEQKKVAPFLWLT